MITKIGIYPGAFDPLTFGHIDIIKRSLNVVDKLIIGVAENINKKHLLSINDRKKLIISDLKTYIKRNEDILVENISHSINLKKKRLILGRTANEYKSNFGAFPIKSYVYLKVKRRFLRFLLTPIFHNLGVKKWKKRSYSNTGEPWLNDRYS